MDRERRVECDDYDGSTSRAVFDHGKARLAGRKQRGMFGMGIVLIRFPIFETSWRRLIE
jgi:hypothetical protein